MWKHVKKSWMILSACAFFAVSPIFAQTSSLQIAVVADDTEESYTYYTDGTFGYHIFSDHAEISSCVSFSSEMTIPSSVKRMYQSQQ